jgi:hypothetical protein
MSTKPPLQKNLQGILHTENESKQKHERMASTKKRRRKDKESQNNIGSAVYNQTLIQQKQLNDSNHHIPINIQT